MLKHPEFWRSVIFSDEGKFCNFGIKGRKLVWRKPCTALQKEHLVPTVKHGGGGVIVIRQHNVSSKDMLKSVLKDQWEKISAEETTRFVRLMLKRLQKFLK
ncbi:transposable element Tc1 transposase [Trichonephila clavipes]|nr:transposable element Tc1 transposase [Trichonephila clavipes]